MFKFSPIYKYVKKQKAIDKKWLALEQQLQKLRKQRLQLQAPFWGGNLDIELYKDFFKEYCISLQYNDPEGNPQYVKFIVTDIKLQRESCPNSRLFWDASYLYKRTDHTGKVLQESSNKMSLRRLLRLMQEPRASFEKL